jgi:hypothetical protein
LHAGRRARSFLVTQGAPPQTRAFRTFGPPEGGVCGQVQTQVVSEGRPGEFVNPSWKVPMQKFPVLPPEPRRSTIARGKRSLSACLGRSVPCGDLRGHPSHTNTNPGISDIWGPLRAEGFSYSGGTPPHTHTNPDISDIWTPLRAECVVRFKRRWLPRGAQASSSIQVGKCLCRSSQSSPRSRGAARSPVGSDPYPRASGGVPCASYLTKILAVVVCGSGSTCVSVLSP